MAHIGDDGESQSAIPGTARFGCPVLCTGGVAYRPGRCRRLPAGLKAVRGSVPEYRAVATAATRLRWYAAAGTRTPFDGHNVVKEGLEAAGRRLHLRLGLGLPPQMRPQMRSMSLRGCDHHRNNDYDICDVNRPFCRSKNQGDVRPMHQW
jgi:hypothetical protein